MTPQNNQSELDIANEKLEKAKAAFTEAASDSERTSKREVVAGAASITAFGILIYRAFFS
jgi:hypothetical protein